MNIFPSFTVACLWNKFQGFIFLYVYVYLFLNRVIITFCGGVALLTAMSVYAGLLAYAAYFGCDPIERHVKYTIICTENMNTNLFL